MLNHRFCTQLYNLQTLLHFHVPHQGGRNSSGSQNPILGTQRLHLLQQNPRDGFAPRAHLSRSRLHRFQQVRHCPGEGPCSSEQVLPAAHLIIHEGRQELHALGHLRQVGRNGGDCTPHSCVVRVCRVTWDREGPSWSKERGGEGGELSRAGGTWPGGSSSPPTTLQESDTRHPKCTVRRVAPYLQDAALHRRLHPEAAYSAMLSTSTFEMPKEG